MEQLERRDLLSVTLNSFVVPSSGQKGDVLDLSADASSDQPGATLNYAWNFGDGATTSGANLNNVTHAYLAPGSPYNVTLTVSDGTSGSATATQAVTITDAPPTVVLDPNQTVLANRAVTIHATVGDPAGAGDIGSIQWDFNYDGSRFNPNSSAAGETAPSVTYAAPGTYVVEAQVTDVEGATTVAATSVVVKPADALIVYAPPTLQVAPGTPVMLNGSYADRGGSVAASGIAWDTNYNGSTFNPTITGTTTPTVTFGMQGTFNVALRITDGNGVSDMAVSQVIAAYQGPTATAGPDQTVSEGGTLSFGGSATDPDGTVGASGVAWDFNYNGSTFNPQTTGTFTPTQTFMTPGNYVVAFEATDNHGVTGVSTLDVTVNNAAPTVSVAANPGATAGALVPFSVSVSDPGGASDSFTYAWDFNYNGSTFNPGPVTSAGPSHAFGLPGTYVVAVQVADSSGATTLATTTVTVTAGGPLVADAGPDQSTTEAGTVTFAGSATDSAGTPDPTTADWDFNYNGQTFNANPSAHGTLTPTQVFNTPGVYLVALRLSDGGGNTGVGTVYVTVANAAPTVSAGADQTVAEGTSVSFGGSASDPGGASDLTNIAWDFNYSGSTFNPQSTGTLAPSHVFTAPGTYEVALQVTDASGAAGLSTAIVTVTDVAPTAAVTNSGPAPEESPVTFTVSNLQDLNPNDTVTYLADWTGSGQFQMLTPDQLTTNQNGSISFTHVYDEGGTYNAVVELVDGAGGATSYTTSVSVTEVAPTVGSFAAQNGVMNVLPTTPFFFAGVTDVSPEDAVGGFTYYVSVDAGAYVSSTSPTSTPLANVTTPYAHTVRGYVVDGEGRQSAVISDTVYLMPSGYHTSVVLNYSGGGQFQVTWAGNASPVTLSGSGSYTTGSASGLTITLLSSNASYTLTTNGAFDAVTAAQGVTGVTLSLNTALNSYNFPGPGVGDGHVGVINLPGGGSTVSVNARGDLTGVIGPSGGGSVTGAQAGSLSFTNLDGSITGLDKIGGIYATGWAGTSASQQVIANGGIGYLSAYGIGATVQADRRMDAGDTTLSLNVGLGGVTSVFTAGAVSTATVAGGLNVLTIAQLAGSFTVLGAINLLDIAGTASVVPPTLKIPNQVKFLITEGKYLWIKAGDVGTLLGRVDDSRGSR